MLFDSALDGGNNNATSNSWTFSFNNVNGDILFVGFLGDASVDDITGVTYNGVALSFVGSNNGVRLEYLYMLVGPTLAKGTHDVVISCTANHYIIAGAVSYSSSKATGQPDNSTTNGGDTSLTTSLTTVADNCWEVLLECGFDGTSPGAGAGTTRRAFDAAFGEWGLFDSNGPKTPAGSVSLTTTRTSSANGISHVMASFAPAVVSSIQPSTMVAIPFL